MILRSRCAGTPGTTQCFFSVIIIVLLVLGAYTLTDMMLRPAVLLLLQWQALLVTPPRKAGNC